MFGELVDKKGYPVLAALSLTPTKDPDNNLEFLVLKSAYGKDQNPQGFIDTSNILYKDETRADAWAAGLRLQLPSAATSIGSSGEMISQEEPSVKPATPIVETESSEPLAEELPGGTVTVDTERFSLASFDDIERDKVRQALYHHYIHKLFFIFTLKNPPI